MSSSSGEPPAVGAGESRSDGPGAAPAEVDARVRAVVARAPALDAARLDAIRDLLPVPVKRGGEAVDAA